MSRLPEYFARARLALRYRGILGIAWRLLTAPLRGAGLIGSGKKGSEHQRAVWWYEEHAAPVTVIVGGDGARAARAARRATKRLAVDVQVVPEGTTAALNAAIAATPHDVILLGPDVIPYDGFVEMLQWYACRIEQDSRDVEEVRACVGARELDPDGTSVRACGLFHDPRSPGRFGDRYRGRSPHYPPAETDVPVIADPGACLYLRRDAVERVGPFDEALPLPWAAIDWSLRAWKEGLRVNNFPSVTVTQLAPPREPDAPGADAFWTRWRDWLERRDVRTPEGKLRVAYVTEDTGVGGGHRVVFEHLNRLAARGHDCALYTLDEPPDWFDLRVPVHSFERYEPLLEDLPHLDAIKVATWWNTSLPVWLAGAARGIASAFVQDIETSYYPDPVYHGRVLASYREEFAPVTTSAWNRDRLRELGLNPEVVSPGIDLGVFRELDHVPRRDDLIVAIGRGHWIKNLDLTVEAWRALGEPAPAELRLYGSEPDTRDRFPLLPYVMRPSDAEVNRLLNEATVFVQTSTHEGFCLPPLEAMAAGCAVVCTDAHGNRDYCEDGVNCLMPEATPEAVAAALRRVLADRELRERLVRNGRETVARYGWEARIDLLERFFESLAPAPALHRAAS